MKVVKILIILFLFSSCETILEDETIPSIPVKAVVFANLNNQDDISRINLTKSKPIINNSTGNDYEVISDAKVTVSGNGAEYTFKYDPINEDYYYTGKLPLSESIEYSLSAQTKSYGEVTSDINMPLGIVNYDIIVDSVLREYETEYLINISITDRPENQFYRVEAFANYIDDTVQVYASKEYQSDENRVNGKVELSTKLYVWEGGDGKNPEVFLVLSSITEDHYQYGKVLETYEPGNPFAEPTPLPSNIVGGLGIFTVSNSSIIRLNY